MTNSSNLPAPYLGVKQNIPVAALQSPYCENLINFNSTLEGITLRNGDSKYSNIALTAADGLFNYGNTKLFMTYYDLGSDKTIVYDVDAAAIAYTPALVAGRENFYGNTFNKNLFLFSPASYAPGFVYNGSAWGNIGYTGATTFSPIGGNNYKNRQYIIQSGEAAYWYSGIDAISGTVTKIDLSGIVDNVCTLSTIATTTFSDNIAETALLAFIFSNGEVLFYTGSYPNSTDWTLVGRSQISQPIDYNSFIDYQSDSLILTDTGLVSLRELFLNGVTNALNMSVNTNVVQTWSDIIRRTRASGSIPNGPITPPLAIQSWVFRGIWDTKNNRIIILFPSYINSSNSLVLGAFYFVFSTIYQSWSFHISEGNEGNPCKDINFYKNKVLVLGEGSTEIMIWEKEGATGFQDRNANDDDSINYSYEMLSAPIPFPKTAVYEATTIEPIIESDLYAETNWNFIADFGKQTSGNQKTDAATTSVAKPAVNVGMQNITYVQVKMSGTTAAAKTVGLDLYSYNVWYNSGDIASR